MHNEIEKEVLQDEKKNQLANNVINDLSESLRNIQDIIKDKHFQILLRQIVLSHNMDHRKKEVAEYINNNTNINHLADMAKGRMVFFLYYPIYINGLESIL